MFERRLLSQGTGKIFSERRFTDSDGADCWRRSAARKTNGYLLGREAECKTDQRRDLRQQVSSLVLAMAGTTTAFIVVDCRIL